MNASEALKKHGSDKVDGHHYGAFYNGLMEQFENPKILEIGVLNGQSLRAWRELFPKSDITGIDIVEWYGKDPSIEFVKADIKKVKLEDKYDIIIDDSSHDLRESLFIITNFTKNLAENGVMVIEDVQIPETYISAMQSVLPEGFELSAYDFRMYSERHDDFIVVITRK